MSGYERETGTIPSLAGITRWTIPGEALEVSFDEMVSDGELDREGIALWAGARGGPTESEVTVTHVVLLRGTGVLRARGFIRIAPEVLNEVTDLLESFGDGVYVAGQIHGHPPYCSTDLSPTDVMYGIRTPHYLSVVAPEYGRRGRRQLDECGVHVFEPRVGWRRLPSTEVASRIAIDTGSSVSVHTVSADADVFGE